MRGLALLAGILCVAAVRSSPAAAPGGDVSHGGYLVNRVAMCVQCHSPRDGRGELDRTRLLKGAPMPIRSPFPGRVWAFSAPSIAGLPGWTDADAIVLLTTGRRSTGYAPKPPMPAFRLSEEDARAAVAYLHSIR
jgi:mono/diheme cytochrome c family protein